MTTRAMGSYSNDGYQYYRTPWPPAMPYERWVPVPGWGMNPQLAGGRRVGVSGIGGYNGALGYDVPISAFGQKTTLKIGIEEAVKKMALDAAAAAIPLVEKKLLPVVLDKAADALVNDAWPRMQPKLRVEIDRAIAIAKTEVRRDLTIVVLALLVTGAGAAWWVRRGRATANARRQRA
jgi:hypothetical protein